MSPVSISYSNFGYILKYANRSVLCSVAAPVAGTASHHVDDQKLFPHCYGGISAKSIVRIMNVVREDDGSFVSIEDL